jgi:hypothetical protein
MTYQIKDVIGPTTYPAAYTLGTSCANGQERRGGVQVVVKYGCYPAYVFGAGTAQEDPRADGPGARGHRRRSRSVSWPAPGSSVRRTTKEPADRWTSSSTSHLAGDRSTYSIMASGIVLTPDVGIFNFSHGAVVPCARMSTTSSTSATTCRSCPLDPPCSSSPAARPARQGAAAGLHGAPIYSHHRHHRAPGRCRRWPSGW